MDLLSVVIPIHNSEKYLDNCIKSVISQTYENIEIILVENNSTDNSLNICQKYAKQDRRVKIVYEKKKGAAVARNCGIMYSTGTYIAFVDSDDYLREDAYEILMSSMKNKHADMICFSYKNVNEDGAELKWYEPSLSRYEKRNEIFTGKELASIFLTSRDIEGFGWNKLFRRSLLIENNFMFDENKRAYEDMAVLFELLSKCDRAILCPEKLYFYRQVSSSLTHADYVLKYQEYRDSLQQIMNCAESMGLFKAAEVFDISRTIWSDYNSLKNGMKIDDITLKYSFKHVFQKLIFNLKSEKLKTVAKAFFLYHRLV